MFIVLITKSYDKSVWCNFSVHCHDKNRTASSKYVSGMQKDLFFCRLPNGIYKITSDANDEQKWV